MTLTRSTHRPSEDLWERSKPAPLPARAAACAAVALLAVTSLHLAARALSGELVVGAGAAAEVVGLPEVLVAALVGSLAAAALAAGAARLPRHGQLVFVSVATVWLVIHGVAAWLAAGSSVTAVWLNLLHLGVAAPLVLGLLGTLPRATRSPAAEGVGEPAP